MGQRCHMPTTRKLRHDRVEWVRQRLPANNDLLRFEQFPDFIAARQELIKSVCKKCQILPTLKKRLLEGSLWFAYGLRNSIDMTGDSSLIRLISRRL